MKKIILLFLILIFVSNLFSLETFFFFIPLGSLNSMSPNNLGIMDEANCLSNKEKLMGLTSSNYLSFCMSSSMITMDLDYFLALITITEPCRQRLKPCNFINPSSITVIIFFWRFLCKNVEPSLFLN